MPADDGNNAWRLGMLIRAVSWLAADPVAALVGNERILVPEEIALDIHDSLDLARAWGFVSAEACSRLQEITDIFGEMSGQQNAHRWSNEAFTTSEEWQLQRKRARALLEVLGLPRNDTLADLPAPIYVFGPENEEAE